MELATKVPESGIWEMKKNGNIVFKKMDAHRQSVVDDNEAFFLQITQKDDYIYEGADLGILVLRGRLMSDDFQLSERAKRWIKGIRSQYRSDLIDISMLSEEDLMEAGDFKMM